MTDFYILKSGGPLDKGHSEGNTTDRGGREVKIATTWSTYFSDEIHSIRTLRPALSNLVHGVYLWSLTFKFGQIKGLLP